MSKLCLNIYKATILNAHYVILMVYVVCDVYVNLVLKLVTSGIAGELALLSERTPNRYILFKASSKYKLVI